MKPLININICWCTCTPTLRTGAHQPWCSGDSLPRYVHCPLPKEVTLQLELGQCSEPNGLDRATSGPHAHPEGCPARAVKVICTVEGETWEQGSIIEARTEDDSGQPWSERIGRALVLAQYRWRLVRDLMANIGGSPQPSSPAQAQAVEKLYVQRDAIFAKLTKMRRSEEDHHRRSVELFEALKEADPERAQVEGPASYAMAWEDPHGEDTNSSAGLRAYLELLLEQVEVLPP